MKLGYHIRDFYGSWSILPHVDLILNPWSVLCLTLGWLRWEVELYICRGQDEI